MNIDNNCKRNGNRQKTNWKNYNISVRLLIYLLNKTRITINIKAISGNPLKS